MVVAGIAVRLFKGWHWSYQQVFHISKILVMAHLFEVSAAI
jgi:hypothetical protein